MTNSRPSLAGGATEAMEDYLDELVDALRLANGAYGDLSTDDVVAVLRHRARLYRDHGLDAIHPRNRAEGDDIPVLEGMFRQTDDGEVEATARRWFNVDVGFKTGVMHGRDITDDQMAEVLTRLAEFIDDHGRTSVGSREKHTN